MRPPVVVAGWLGQLGRQVATVVGELGIGAGSEGVGDPVGPPQSLPHAGAHGLFPPSVVLLLEAGGAAKISPETPPLLHGVPVERSLGGYMARVEAQWVRLRQNFCKGFTPRIFCVRFACNNFARGPPLCC